MVPPRDTEINQTPNVTKHDQQSDLWARKFMVKVKQSRPPDKVPKCMLSGEGCGDA